MLSGPIKGLRVCAGDDRTRVGGIDVTGNTAALRGISCYAPFDEQPRPLVRSLRPCLGLFRGDHAGAGFAAWRLVESAVLHDGRKAVLVLENRDVLAGVPIHQNQVGEVAFL